MKLANLTSREKKILNILINSDDYLTAKELSEKIGVSKRTISRELAKLKKFVKNSDLQLESKPSVGIYLTGEKEVIEEYKSQLNEFDSTLDYSPEGRKQYIIKQFLFSSRFQKSTALAHRLAVTKATISYDLNKVAEWFEERGLKLSRRQGVGIELEGPEAKFRNAIIDFLYEDIGEEKFLNLVRSRIDNDFDEEKPQDTILQTKLDFLNFISFETSQKIQKAVEEILNNNEFQMVNSSYMGLIIHLALAIKRLQDGEEIVVSDEKLTQLKTTKEYKLAERIADRLEDIFNLEIPDDEKGYITMHLKGAKIRKDIEFIDEPLEDDELEAIKYARQLVKEVQKDLSFQLINDYSLISGLTTHLEPALSRLRMGLEIRNPILDEIKSEYTDIFEKTKNASQLLAEELNTEIPDSEIGYLTMHIASAIENFNTSQNHLRALVVCSSGIGSSKILAARLHKALDNVKIVAETSALSIKEYMEQDIDIIISTVALEDYQDKTIVVSPMLTKSDIKKINRQVNKLNINKMKKEIQGEGKERQVRSIDEKLKIISKLSEDTLKLIEEFQIINLEDIEKYEEILERISKAEYYPEGFDVEKISKNLQAREAKGATIIPEMKLALMHSRVEDLPHPYLSLVILDKEVKMDNIKKEVTIDRVIILLAPQNILKEQLDLLSKFSASIIENESFSEIIHANSREEFLNYFREIMDNYFSEYIDM